MGSLRDRKVAWSASDRQGSNFESSVWRTGSSQSSHHPQGVLLAQFSRYVHKGGLKPDSFHFESIMRKFTSVPTTTTLSVHVSDSLIAVITFNVPSCTSVFSTLKHQCLLNSWMALIFTKCGEFEHWTETVLPSSLILYFICYIFIAYNIAVCIEMFLM